jgi:hypothetical protein
MDFLSNNSSVYNIKQTYWILQYSIVNPNTDILTWPGLIHITNTATTSSQIPRYNFVTHFYRVQQFH